MHKVELTMKVPDEEKKINIFKSMKFPNYMDDFFRIDSLNVCMIDSEMTILLILLNLLLLDHVCWIRGMMLVLMVLCILMM